MASNTIKVLTAISKEISRRFDVRADLIGSFNRQYDEPRTAFGSNSGSSIEIKQPQKLTATESATLDIQDLTETTATLNVNNNVHVGLAFTASQLTQDLLNPNNMKMFADDYLDSAIDNIITKMQTNFSTFIHQSTYNSVGTPGTGPTSYQVITQARAKLNNNRAPRTNRCFILDPDNAALLNNAQVGLFHPGDAISSNYKDGSLNASNGFAFKECPDITTHTNGAGASYAVDGAAQTGATVLLKTGTGAVTKGTVVTFAGCFDVDPVSGAAKKNLKQFVVNTAFAGGAGSIAITPSITTSGALKTCSASPTDSGAMTILGAASGNWAQGIAAHRDSFVFATAKLADIGVEYEVPIITGGAGDGYSKDGGPQKGVSMKLYMDGDITNRRAVARLDALYGYANLIPEWATRVQGE
jgi:hypothetical protein